MKQTSSKSFSLREKELAFVALYPLVSLDWRLKCTKVKKKQKKQLLRRQHNLNCTHPAVKIS